MCFCSFLSFPFFELFFSSHFSFFLLWHHHPPFGMMLPSPSLLGSAISPLRFEWWCFLFFLSFGSGAAFLPYPIAWWCFPPVPFGVVVLSTLWVAVLSPSPLLGGVPFHPPPPPPGGGALFIPPLGPLSCCNTRSDHVVENLKAENATHPNEGRKATPIKGGGRRSTTRNEEAGKAPPPESRERVNNTTQRRREGKHHHSQGGSREAPPPSFPSSFSSPLGGGAFPCPEGHLIKLLTW